MLICFQEKAKGSVGKSLKKETWAGKDPVIFSFSGLGSASFIHLPFLEGTLDSFFHLWVSLAP